MLRLRVTDLESMRYYKNAEDATLDKLLSDLAHVATPTRQMMAGGALAEFFEHAKDDVMDSVVSKGWRFDFDLDADVRLPAVREVKTEMVFQTTSGPVLLVGKADGVDGITVRDQKLTERLDIEEMYADSLQWRAYLVMFKAQRFIYDVFVGRYAKDDDMVTVREYHQVPFYAYPGMADDVRSAVNELAEVVTKHREQIAHLQAAAARKAA